MIAWINFTVLIISGVLMHIFYLMSVRPAALEQKIGPQAYKRSALYRRIVGVFMFLYQSITLFTIGIRCLLTHSPLHFHGLIGYLQSSLC